MLGFLHSLDAGAQCTALGPTVIPDDSTIALGFLVSGLIDGNLSSPTQGICGVEIEFNHEYLGDLTVTLISPSGTAVELIGPATTASMNTQLATWDVDFLPCGSPANPDAGFSAVWSNEDAWMDFGFYNGSYHPFQGCLENFNTGPANGLWQFIVEDHDPFQTGSILSVTLIFCNPAGLACEECLPNAGAIGPAFVALCEGDNIQSSSFIIDYGSPGPPGADYLYQLLFVSGNTILQHGPFFSVTPPAGNYNLCGLSYHEDDTVFVHAVLQSGDYDILLQIIADGDVCGQITTPCVTVMVEAPPDTTYVNASLCQGEVFSYGGQNYTSTGIFYQMHDGPGICDSVFEIRIAPRALLVDIPVPDTLFCGGNQINLEAMVSGAPGPYTYLWTTTFGNIVSSPILADIIVDQAGSYAVSITDGLCHGSASVGVVADQGYPQVFVTGGTLSCNQVSVDLAPIYIPSDGQIAWAGPGNFTSNQPNVNVSEPGIYFLTITNQQGCATTESVTISIDTATAAVAIYPLPKNCAAQNIILGISSPFHIAAADWTGPNGFVYSSPIFGPTVSDPGLYQLTVTFDNGCQRSASYVFDGDFAIPDLTIPITDTINCSEVISLVASSMVTGAQYHWSGPEFFSGNQASIQVSQPGIYTAVVTAPNGCTNQGSITIEEGGDLFEYQIFTETITCLQDTVPVQVISSVADVFDWINYNGPDQGLSTIHVTTSGLYSVMMTDTQSGCVITTSIWVPANLATPSFGYVTDTITCFNTEATMYFVPIAGNPVMHVYWELPDFTIVQSDTIESGLPGVFRLYGVGPNGCAGVWQIEIPRDTMPPFLLVESDTLSCTDTVQILSQSLESIVTYTWSGPGIILDNGASVDVNVPGLYTLVATGINGCPTAFNIVVDSNFTLPEFVVVHDSIRCDRDAMLAGVSQDASLTYSWFDETGQVISHDSVFQTNIPGLYLLEVQGANDCIDTASIRLSPVQYPEVALSADTLTCAVLSVLIQSDIDIAPASTFWTTMAGDTIGMMANLTVVDQGPFVLSVTGPNGCATSDTISIEFDTLSPDAEIELIGEVRCQLLDVMFSALQSTPANLSYLWSTINGNILSDPALSLIDARDTGTYYLSVIDPDNGCVNIDSFHLTPSPDAIALADFTITRPACSGEFNGGIEVTGIIGGIGPFLYQLNSGTLQTNPFFSGLGSGTYTITVYDAEGCEYDTTVQIDPVLPYTADAGPDMEIFLGESVDLSGTTDLPVAEIMDQHWDSLGISICNDCPDVLVAPWETVTYEFVVESATGCVQTDEVTVFVIEKGKYFIPNVFSPNGDGVNDEVRLHPTPGMERVLQWVIFDRWGDAVFGKTDFDPWDPAVYWDGSTTTGSFANPAVFPYLIEYQLINGKRELRHGTITLIR